MWTFPSMHGPPYWEWQLPSAADSYHRPPRYSVTDFVDRLHTFLDDGKVPFAIYMDLSKAFDTLDHQILLSKLNHYGIINTELKWFSSYLTERSQYVEYNGTMSDSAILKTGVPHGFILGHLLFLIYINDLHLASNFISLMFDTNLISTYCNFKCSHPTYKLRTSKGVCLVNG